MNETLELHEIDGGNVILQVNEYIQKIIEDIADPNKKAEIKRTLTLRLEFAPSKARRDATVRYDVDIKPAGHVAREETVIYLGKNKDGQPIAKPWIPNQQQLPGTEVSFSDEDEDDQKALASDVH